jgi:hypothetical protein
MLKEFLDSILARQNAEILEIGGKKYTTQVVYAVKDAQLVALNVSTLTGLIDYYLANVDALDPTKLIVHVEDHANVKLLSALHGDFAQRDCLLHVKADLLQMKFNTWVESEPFNIFMQACFQETLDRAAVLKVVGNIRESAVRETRDDGVSQEVTAKSGIGRVENVTVPNPVILKPFRTFVEVDQPASQFVFRMKTGPECMLVEADGGAWRNEARKNIAAFLAAALGDGAVIIA